MSDKVSHGLDHGPAPPRGSRAATDAAANRVRLLPWFRWWADLLDSRFRIPGTDIRFGIDPLLSLVPGIGDLASPVFTAALLAQVLYQRIPRVVVLRMVMNALIDAAIGVIPIAGLVGDIFWRANLRNLALLEQYAEPGRAPARGDYLFVLAVTLLCGVVVAVPVSLGLWLAITLWQAL